MKALLALLLVTALVGCGGRESTDCEAFSFDRAAFRRDIDRIELERDTAAERRLNAAAVALVECGRLTGRTPEDVRALLGPPSYRSGDDNPRPHREYGYIIGYDREAASDNQLTLFMEFDRGRVVYAEAADGNVHDVIVDGEPVGGGPKVN